MDADFWHNKWENKHIGFHQAEVNDALREHLTTLNLAPGSRVFVPLCGKTLDIHWLLAQGHGVIGVELSPIAVSELFEELGVIPQIRQCGELNCYQYEDLTVYQGDFFALTAADLGPIDAVYDRAALVALPESLRTQYTDHLMTLTQMAPQLLLTFEYDQELVQGPPFSVRADEVARHYDAAYHLRELLREDIPGGMRGLAAAQDVVWYLQPLTQEV